jgi:hypothetical protein
MLSFKVFGWVICLFRFNRNIETLCFGIEAKQPNQNKPQKTAKNQKTPKFSEKITKYAPYQTVSVGLLLFRFNRNIKTFCFGKEAKQPKQPFFGSDSAETSFGSSFGCFESKLVSKDTLI